MPRLLYVFAALMLCLNSSWPAFAYHDDAIEDLDYMADALNVQPERAEIKLLRAQVSLEVSAELRLARLERRFTHKLLADYFAVSATIAELNNEISFIQGEIEDAQLKSDRKMELINILNFATSGTLTGIGSSLSIPGNSRPTNGAIFGAVAAGTTTLLSLAALTASHSSHLSVKRPPNMLVFVFDPDANDDRIFPLPAVVRDYLHRHSDQRTSTRAQVLITAWQKAGYIDGNDIKAPDVKSACNRVGHVALSQKILEHQVAMLQSMRTSIYQMNKGLQKLAEDDI